MLEKKPIEDINEFIKNISPLLELIYEKDTLNKLFNMSSNDIINFLNSPRTFIYELEKEFSKNLKTVDFNKIDDIFPILFKTDQFLQKNMKEFLLFLKKRVENNQSLKSFYNFAINLSKSEKKNDLINLLNLYIRPDIFSLLGSSPGLGELVENENINFEKYVGIISNHLHYISEKYYRPMLSLLLQITQLTQVCPKKDPQELGKICYEAKNLWKRSYPDFLSIIENRINIIRNSEAHKNSIINIENETITFINIRPDKSTNPFGPLSKIDFEKFSQEFIYFILDINYLIELIKIEITFA